MFIERLDRIVRISNERFDASLNPSFDRRFFNRTRVCNSILWSSKRQDFGILDRYFLPPPFFFLFQFYSTYISAPHHQKAVLDRIIVPLVAPVTIRSGEL